MAKLTRKQKSAIELALYALGNADKFIMQPSTHIVCESSITTFPASAWTSGEGIKGIAITKELGSDLVGVRRAIKVLENLLGDN